MMTSISSFTYLWHRKLRGRADARLLTQVQEGLHPAGTVVALGVDCGDVVVARLEDEVHHDAGLGGGAQIIVGDQMFF